MSGLSIEDVLSLPAMHGTKVIAGAQGLHRVVKSVNVMEVPDVENFVRSGDLLLTTTYPISSNPQQLTQLVKYFAAENLAGLAIKPGRYLHSWPKGLFSLCDSLKFPLLQLESDVAFDDIIGEVLAVVLSDYGPEPSQADAIREKLTNIALSGGGLKEIGKALSSAILCPVLITDTSSRVLSIDIPQNTYSPQKSHFPWLQNHAHQISLSALDSSALNRYQIKIGDDSKGEIIVLSYKPLKIGQKRLIRQACFAAGLHIAQQRAAAEVNKGLKVLALEEAVSAPSGYQSRHVGLFGWNLEAADLVIVAANSGFQAERKVKTLWGKSALSWQRGNDTVVIALEEEIGKENLENRARTWLTSLPADSIVAIGESGNSDIKLADLHASALQALNIAKRIGTRVALYSQLSLELLLLSLGEFEAKSFINNQLGKLIKSDEEKGSQLVETMRAVLENSSKLDAAKELVVHYNTLKYRVGKINQITGSDWEVGTNRIRYIIALELLRLYNK